MASVTYYTASGQNDFRTATPIGLPIWDKPFPELTDRLLFRQRYMIGASYYVPVTPNVTYDYPGPISANVPTATSFYLVGESNFADQRGGLLEWDRVYAAVPTTRYEYGTYPYMFPAIRPSITTAGYSTITYAAQSGGGRMFITTTLTPQIGERVALSYSSAVINAVIVRDYGPGGIVTDLDSSFVSATFRQIAPAYATFGRQFPYAAPARSIVQYDYVLITPNVTPVFTFNSRQKYTTFRGEEVQYVDSYTTPNSVSYLSWIGSTTATILAEDDQWSRWIGNIYEKKSTKIFVQ